MNGMEWIVVLAAAGAIAWVNWYFFVAGRGGRTDRGHDGNDG
ncbi:MAG: hypothetical protein ACYC3Q_15605 [Gemmatimonadaceae bacterium]